MLSFISFVDVVLLSVAVLESSPEYVIRSQLPIIETTGLLVIIVWTQISAMRKKICSAFATVAVWYDTNLSVLHTALTKVMFPKCTSFLDAESAVTKESS